MTLNTSSFVVFLKFIDAKEEDGVVKVDRVFSRECYEFWLSTRTFPPKRPEESFRKALTSHCRGVDGRKPFPPEIEAALLKQMRKKQVWACFKGTAFNIGKRGYQVRGFWESAGDANEESNGNSHNQVSSQASSVKRAADTDIVDSRRVKRSHSDSSYGMTPPQANFIVPGAALESLIALQNFQNSMLGTMSAVPNFSMGAPIKTEFYPPGFSTLGQPGMNFFNPSAAFGFPQPISMNMNMGLLDMLNKATASAAAASSDSA